MGLIQPGPKGSTGATGAPGGGLLPTTGSGYDANGPYWFLLGRTTGVSEVSIGTLANRLFALPFTVSTNCTVTGLGGSAVSNGTGKFIVGIYNSTSNNYPNSNIGISGEFDTSTSGFKTTSSLSISLIAGALYWAALVNNSGLSFYGLPATASLWQSFMGSGGANTTLSTGFSATYTYNSSLPGTFPASAGQTSTTVPAVWATFG